MRLAEPRIWRPPGIEAAPRPIELPTKRRPGPPVPARPGWPRWRRPRPQFPPASPTPLPEMLIKRGGASLPIHGPTGKPVTQCSSGGGGTAPPCWPCTAAVPAKCLLTLADVTERSEDPEAIPDCFGEWLADGATCNGAWCLTRDLPPQAGCVSYSLLGINAGTWSSRQGTGCVNDDFATVWFNFAVWLTGTAFVVVVNFSTTNDWGTASGALFDNFEGGLVGDPIDCGGGASVEPNTLTFGVGDSVYGQGGTATVDVWTGC